MTDLPLVTQALQAMATLIFENRPVALSLRVFDPLDKPPQFKVPQKPILAQCGPF